MLTARASPSSWSHVMRPGLLISFQAAGISGRVCVSLPTPRGAPVGREPGGHTGGACSQHVQWPARGQWKVTVWRQESSEWIAEPSLGFALLLFSLPCAGSSVCPGKGDEVCCSFPTPSLPTLPTPSFQEILQKHLKFCSILDI
uniref:Uncharacterized protein n=1 Tax=Macaca fascicularis TaxID=9541 RepID=Q9BE32_MACFA|nr:hypothetical protein [Macaca fascicularis]